MRAVSLSRHRCLQLKLGHDLREIHSTVSREQHLAPTATHLKLKHNLNFDVPAGTDITKKSAVAKETQASIEITSKKYKSVADRSSMLFFLMSDLAKIHSYYVYLLAAYTKVFYRGIDLVTDKPEPELDDEGNELPVKVVELNDEELAARC